MPSGELTLMTPVVDFAVVAAVGAIAVGDFAASRWLAFVARSKPRFIDGIDRRNGGWLAIGLDGECRLFVVELVDFLERRRGERQLGRGNQIAERNARIERRHIDSEIAAAAERDARRRPGFGIDEQRGKVAGRHFDAAEDQLGDEHRAVDDDHLRAVGHVDDEVAADDMDIGQLNAGRQSHHAVGSGDDLLGVGIDFFELAAEIDGQGCGIAGACAIRQGVAEYVAAALGRGVVGLVAIAAAAIHRQLAEAALDVEAAALRSVAAAGALERDDLAGPVGYAVRPGNAGDGAGAGDGVAGGRSATSRRQRVCVIARIGSFRRRIVERARSIFVSHDPPLLVRRNGLPHSCFESRCSSQPRLPDVLNSEI